MKLLEKLISPFPQAFNDLLDEETEYWDQTIILFMNVPTNFVSSAWQCREEEGAGAVRLPFATRVPEGTAAKQMRYLAEW